MKAMARFAFLLTALLWGCEPSWSTPRYPGATIMGRGKGPLAVHVKTLEDGGESGIVWERTLMAWPDAPVFLSDGKEFAVRLWVVPASQGAFIYTETGGVTEVAEPPTGTPLRTVSFGETFSLKGEGGIRFLITVDQL